MRPRGSPRRWFWILPAPALAIAAYCQAHGANALLRGALAKPEAVARTARSLPEPARVRASADAVLERNAFDSRTGPLTRNPSATSPSATPVASDPLRAPRCQGVRVVVTAQSTNPLESTAVVQAEKEPHGIVRRVGDEVAGRRVAFIGRNRLEWSPAVWLLGEDGLCQSLLFDAPPEKPAAPKAAPAPSVPAPSRSRPPAAPLPPDIARRIARVGPNTFRIERSAVEDILELGTGLVRSVRLRASQEDGKVVGFQLKRVPPGTLLDVLGLEAGDQLQSINGFALTGPAQALQAYARLRAADSIRVTAMRDGKPLELEYRIQ